MRYLPKSPADREAMLAEIGVASIESLFETIPAEYRLTEDLKIPRQHSESEILERFRAFGSNVASGDALELAAQPAGKLFASFLGAGAYRHYRPVIIDSLVQRGEFLTSYTPYQPEISQGTLQAMFEFQTMICELTGMEIANASMYDGSTGAAESVLMACRVTGRQGAVVARTVHPEYREVLATVTKHQEIPITEFGYVAETGRVDLAALDAAITDETACVLIQSPNFFGTVEDVAAIAEIAHKKGALLIVSIAEAVSLGVIKAPVEADIVSLEAQSFGVAVGFGGPYCGVIACKEKFLRQMPGRLVGETKDTNGKRGWVLTLSTREQHIRREKATSNICTNQALVAMMVTIFLTVYGKQGLRELAEQNLAKADYLRKALVDAGAVTKFDGAPRFHEFVLTTKESAAAVNAKLLEKQIVGGLGLGKWYPELGESATLWCATELTTKAQMDAAAKVLAGARAQELVGVK
ncbi:aminomethyl-transferring glycine dehydrogenase subunit GcvPA [Granulicella sp. L46]|jgi:glycine dehydrogenase subunit 1|uniref:aminomethyl-transferring glycine dehydrogenase subunit GcvPA n=1 Tax=Granulicella sp. L46 TaxID=1641865 RepID=UPI00131E8C38|nr:aminomethyl-transferring glycine dehydrogenase subunit GcvPA [Granulicella sp. L46]